MEMAKIYYVAESPRFYINGRYQNVEFSGEILVEESPY
jgi:hypothetical protein